MFCIFPKVESFFHWWGFFNVFVPFCYPPTHAKSFLFGPANILSMVDWGDGSGQPWLIWWLAKFNKEMLPFELVEKRSSSASDSSESDDAAQATDNCQFCTYTSKVPSALTRHVSKMHADQCYQCKWCKNRVRNGDPLPYEKEDPDKLLNNGYFEQQYQK